MLTLAEVLQRSQDWLAARGVPSPRREAELLAQAALGLDRLQLVLQRERPLEAAERDAIRALVQRRGAREPLAWILGRVGFHDIDLQMRPGVLVPRPDTEALVEAALRRIPADAALFLADVGCGSGAIGLAVAAARPGVKVYAIDLSEEALALTRENVARLGLQARVAVLRGDLLAAIPPQRPVDLVLSNPPYIPSAQIEGLEPEVARFEPRRALDGGEDGLAVYRRLLPQVRARARLGVLLEIGHDQGPAVAALARQQGLEEVRVEPDLARRDRVVVANVPGARFDAPPAPEGEWVVEELAEADPALDEEGRPLPVLDADR